MYLYYPFLCQAAFEISLRRFSLSTTMRASSDYEELTKWAEQLNCSILNVAVSHRIIKFTIDLIANGEDVNAKDRIGGYTPLHALALDVRRNIYSNTNYFLSRNISDYTDLRLAKILIESGADLNAVNRRGETVLELAVESCSNVPLIQYLIDCGANVNKGNIFPNIGYALSSGRREKDRTTELYVSEMLLRNGADVNFVSSNLSTTLHILVFSSSGNEEAVKLFLRYKADIHARDFTGASVIISANVWKRHGEVNMSQLLIDHGANVNDADFQGNTALHFACLQPDPLEIVKIFLKNGADLNACNSEGSTALMYYLMYLEEDPVDPNINYENLIFLLSKWPNVNTVDNDGKNVLTKTKIEKCNRIILEHLAKIEMLNLTLHLDLIKTISGNNDFKNYFVQCKEELIKAAIMKKPDYHVSFFNLLVADVKKLINYAGNKGLMEYFEKFELETIFPIYGSTIKKSLVKAKERRSLYDKSAKSLTNCLPMVNLNDLVIEKILGFLKKKDLKNLISAAQVQIGR